MATKGAANMNSIKKKSLAPAVGLVIGLLAALPGGKAQAQTCTPFSTFHLVSTTVPTTPPSELLQPNGTGANGFFPTHLLTASGFIWSTVALSGSFNSGTYTLVLWTNTPPGPGASRVFAQLGVSNDDGSNFQPIVASAAVDVKSTGTGNHTTPLVMPAPATINLINQRLVVKVFYDPSSPGSAPTMVYNGGTDFDTRLNTAGGCAQPTVTTTYHLVDAAVSGVSPAGKLMQPAGTNANGFFPTVVLDATARFWYSPVVNGSLPASDFRFIMWTNSPGAPAPVTVRVERTGASGSSPVTLVSSTTLDVNASGTGNHTTTFGPVFVPAQSLSGQRLRVVITGPSSTPRPVMVYNGGTDFDTRLVITSH
jgi:hypothetical protein